MIFIDIAENIKNLKTEKINSDAVYDVRGDTPYLNVLTLVQAYMSKLEKLEGMEVFAYKKSIENFITNEKITCNETEKLSELVDRLYNSMAQYDILTPYLEPETYNKLGIEEIYGRWDCIYLLTKKGKVQLKEKFPSAENAKDILNRMGKKFNVNINETTPKALGEFRPNIRMAVMSNPVTSNEAGAEFSIRIVHGSDMSRSALIGKYETIDELGLDFLELCMSYKANICIGGATGSGKTGTMYYLLSCVSQDDSKRIGTIEVESREFDLVKKDKKGNVKNDIFHWVTRFSNDSQYNITSDTLAEAILRFRPDIIGVGEMRNKEALSICEIAITGHGVITTTHADDATSTYDRLVMLCKKADVQYDDKTLYNLVLKAFPIIVYQKQLPDKSRKILEIVEGVDYKDDNVVVNPLFKYEITDNQENSQIVIGAFKQVGKISDKLKKRFIDNGVSTTRLKRF